MNIWFFNHYAVPPQYFPLVRPYYFAKNLIKYGYNVSIFAASTIHNSNHNVIENKELFRKEILDEIKYIYIKTSKYEGNGIDRIKNMFEYTFKLFRIVSNFKKPDVILATSVHPLACVAGIKIAKKYNCKCIIEIADLWPESFVTYGIINKKNPLLRLLYAGEKWIYKKADKIIFTMEGGRDYIVEKGWDKDSGGPIDINKVYYINNGVDLETFNYNKEHYKLEDEDLNDSKVFKVIYTGSIRLVNKVEMLVDVAKELQYQNIKFLIWGDGDQVQHIKERMKRENVKNIILKGRVDKKYIPYITSKADINIILGTNNPLYKYGVSLNKMFDYFAAEKPILSTKTYGYSLIKRYNAGTELEISSIDNIVQAILEYKSLCKQEYDEKCRNAMKAAEDYDFKILTDKLEQIILELEPKQNNKQETYIKAN